MGQPGGVATNGCSALKYVECLKDGATSGCSRRFTTNNGNNNMGCVLSVLGPGGAGRGAAGTRRHSHSALCCALMLRKADALHSLPQCRASPAPLLTLHSLHPALLHRGPYPLCSYGNGGSAAIPGETGSDNVGNFNQGSTNLGDFNV